MVLPSPTWSAKSEFTRGHPQSPHDRVELVILDGDAGSERRLERSAVGGGDGTPPHRIKERVKANRIVEPAELRTRQGGRLEDRGPWLDLPDHAQLVTEAVVLYRCQLDQVLGVVAVEGRRLQVADDPVPVPDGTSWPTSGTATRERTSAAVTPGPLRCWRGSRRPRYEAGRPVLVSAGPGGQRLSSGFPWHLLDLSIPTTFRMESAAVMALVAEDP